jgi:hypothetical protein
MKERFMAAPIDKLIEEIVTARSSHGFCLDQSPQRMKICHSESIVGTRKPQQDMAKLYERIGGPDRQARTRSEKQRMKFADAVGDYLPDFT